MKCFQKNIYNNNLQCDKTMYLIDIFSSLSRAHRYNFYPYITGMSKSEYGCTQLTFDLIYTNWSRGALFTRYYLLGKVMNCTRITISANQEICIMIRRFLKILKPKYIDENKSVEQFLINVYREHVSGIRKILFLIFFFCTVNKNTASLLNSLHAAALFISSDINNFYQGMTNLNMLGPFTSRCCP